MTSPHRCTSEASLVSTVTGMFGYCPSESLVLLPLAGPVGGALLRFDLPPRDALLTRDDLDGWVNVVLGLTLHVDGITAIAAIVFANEPVAAPPRPELVSALARGADRTGLRLVAPLFRAHNAWGRYDAPAATPGPALRPLHELGDAGQLPLTEPPREVVDTGQGERLRTSDTARRVGPGESAIDVLDRLLEGDAPELHPDDVERVRATLGGAASSPHDVDQLLACVGFSWQSAARWGGSAAPARGRGPLSRALQEGRQLETGDDATALSLDHALLYDTFDPDRCERALPLLRSLARQGTSHQRGGVLAVIAWTHWALGHGSLAHGYAEQALDADPALELADDVRMLVARGHVPPWFGKPPRRWTATAAEVARDDADPIGMRRDGGRSAAGDVRGSAQDARRFDAA